MKFSELTQAALLGTERQPLASLPAAGALGRLAGQLDIQRREQSLLALAALLGLYERAGRLAGRDSGPLPAACAAESLPRANDRAGSLLLRLLAGEWDELLPEWLALGSRAGQLAPPETLPPLLARGAAKAGLRQAMLPVLGERGRWLAAQNPEWAWVNGAATEDEKLWHIGEGPARLLFLERLRQANPQRARELLASTWKEETPEERAAFLALLETGLSAEDEAFLEAGLDDKRKEVRRTAAALLGRLPESALARRMRERVASRLKFVPGATGSLLKLKKAKSAQIEVVLPEICDKAMQRDGIELRPAQGLGEKAWWLIQMLEAAPLELWLREWQATPAEVLAASLAGDWKKELFEAWSRAAVRQRQADWAQAALEVALEQQRLDKIAPLLDVLSDRQREACLMELLTSNNPKVREMHGALVGNCRHAWSREFSLAVLNWLRQLTARQSADWALRSQFKSFALHLHPATFGAAATGWKTEGAGWEFWLKGAEEFFAAVQFRADLHSAFAAASSPTNP